jgi:4-azaleucine resistance transporter AzlC
MRRCGVNAAEFKEGARVIAPMLVGVVPFGLVAGATPVARGFGADVALGFSTIVFAGASQLAAIDVLSGGGSAVVAALAAWTVNLRMLLYSASLAPHLAHEPLHRRLGAAYLLTDQAYAVSISRWSAGGDPARRLSFYFGGALLLSSAWIACTAVGAVAGAAVPDEVPLGFAVPLVFLVLLVPALADRPAIAAAVAGGLGAVAAAELGAGHLSIMVGATAGIVTGTAVDTLVERRAATGGQRAATAPQHERRDQHERGNEGERRDQHERGNEGERRDQHERGDEGER